MSPLKLLPEDFNDYDWDDVVIAGCAAMNVVSDIAFHNLNPGEGWDPFTQDGDTPALIGEVRAHLDRLEAAVKSARRQIADVERPARLRAARREKNTQQGDPR